MAKRGYLAYMNKQLVPDRLIVDKFNDYASAVFSRRHKLIEEDPALAVQRDALQPGLVSEEVRVGAIDRRQETNFDDRR